MYEDHIYIQISCSFIISGFQCTTQQRYHFTISPVSLYSFLF